jgi:hypothetical protein
MRARLPGLLVLLVAASLVVADGAQAAKKLRASTLVRFGSCTQLTDFARSWMVRTDGTTGVPGRVDTIAPAVLRGPQLMPVARRGDEPLAMPVAAPQQAEAGAGADTAFSTTNTQEAGVDEPDLVKTDGRTLYAVHDGALRVFDVSQAAPKLVGTLKLPGADHQLLLRGPRLLVLANLHPTVGPEPVLDRPAMSAPARPSDAKVLLTEVDVATPAAPKVARTMELAGRLVDGRLTGGIARVVVASTPAPVAISDPPTAGADVRTRDVVPTTTIKSRISRKTFKRSVVPCRRVRHPRAFSGLDLVTVLTVDLDKGLYDVDRDAVMAGAQDVYASGTSLVVATRRYDARADDELGFAPTGGTTELHVFAADDTPATTYRGSGSVPGFILNQFAISEHEGAFRVATTEDAPFGPQGPRGRSESGVSVLKVADGRLTTVGRVTGLGKGERIYAVRFLGDRGYVVTFRQVDPLYALDLRDPAKPRVTGELKVAGYSAYLHPISERLLVGVGQDATDEGRRLGPQVSLFDVGDPAAPKLLGRATLGASGSSAVEGDHHAFLWWAPLNLAVVPLETYDHQAPERSFAGAVAFRVGTSGVGEIGRITHPKPGPEYLPPPIGRSVVVGDRLLTLSHAGLAVNGLADLAPLGFTAFG